ncbi:MAG: hypothetical protein ACLQRH_23255 [Acidimicrobiales bacterium]
MTPVSSNDEKDASEGECNACDDRSRNRHLEGWDLSGDEPDTGKQDQGEANLGECDARLMAQCKHINDGSYFDRSLLPATEQNLLSFRDFPRRAAGLPPTRLRTGTAGESHFEYVPAGTA